MFCEIRACALVVGELDVDLEPTFKILFFAVRTPQPVFAWIIRRLSLRCFPERRVCMGLTNRPDNRYGVYAPDLPGRR